MILMWLQAHWKHYTIHKTLITDKDQTVLRMCKLDQFSLPQSNILQICNGAYLFLCTRGFCGCRLRRWFCYSFFSIYPECLFMTCDFEQFGVKVDVKTCSLLQADKLFRCVDYVFSNFSVKFIDADWLLSTNIVLSSWYLFLRILETLHNCFHKFALFM